MKKIALLFLISVFMCSCGATLHGPIYSSYRAKNPMEVTGKSRLNFISSNKMKFGQSSRLYIDDQMFVELPVKACTYKDVNPGHRTVKLDIWGDFGEFEQSYDLASNKEYFFLIKPRGSASFAKLFGIIGSSIEYAAADGKNDGSLELERISKEQAEELMPQCKLYPFEDTQVR